jgi:hypothetical protein
MKNHVSSRRSFLRGSAGFLLATPLLTSLLPRQARAQATVPVRYVQWVTNFGQYGAQFWPDEQYAPEEVVAGGAGAGVKARALSAISGPISTVLGATFDPVRAKLNVVRGLSLIVDKHFHNACAPTCASWPREDNHVPFFSYSVDAILEQSRKFYPQAVRVPVLRMTPGVNSSALYGSFCWTTQNGKPFKLPCLDSTAAALTAVFSGGASGSAGAAQQAARAAQLRLTDVVIEDYRRVSNGSAIGSADRALLSSYMDLLADVQNRMKVEAPACTPPSQLTQRDFDVLHQNATDIAVAAMLCGATRAVAYHCLQGSSKLSYDYNTFHGWAHEDAQKHAFVTTWRYAQAARLIQKMNSFVEGNGRTLLDNSLVYLGNELSVPNHGEGHLQNMPIVTAGSAGGRLTTGQYIDFGDRPMNNLLVTIFAAMGLGPEDYERGGAPGFGDYVGTNAAEYAAYTTPAERRKPLPFLFLG